MTEFCIKTKMAHYEGRVVCQEFSEFTLFGIKHDERCYWVPKKDTVFDEREYCGDDVRKIREMAEDFKDRIYSCGGWHIKTEQYLKFDDGTKQEIREKPFLTCGFLWGAEFCWMSNGKLRVFLDKNSNEYTVHFLGRKWLCFAKKKD